MAKSTSSNESGHDYSGKDEPNAFSGERCSDSSNEDPNLEAFEISVRPQMIQPLSMVPPQDTAAQGSDEAGNTVAALLKRFQAPAGADEAGPSVRVDLEGTGTTEELFGENEEGDPEDEGDGEAEEEEGEAEEGKAKGERRNSGEDASTSQPTAKTVAAHRMVQNPYKPTMIGKVRFTPCILTVKDLNQIMTKYNPEGVLLRIPAENEVACSDLSPEVCLYEHMFQWGLIILMGEKSSGQLYIAAIFALYGLSPGQVVANSFAYVSTF